METRTFLICDDEHEDFIVGRITRTQDEVIPELWDLPIGDFYQCEQPNRSFTRES